MTSNSKKELISEWRKCQSDFKQDYILSKNTFVKSLLPEVAVQLNSVDVLNIIAAKFGQSFLLLALDPNKTIDSPLINEENGDWLKKTQTVGVNIRTIGNFFNLIKYALTLSSNQDTIHILPIWEPGVVGSLYGKTSWNLNPEFFSYELASIVPWLNSTEKQLKAVVNLLHLMGKKVGLDIIPHTDRFSEITMLYPHLFEWVYRHEHEIISIKTENADIVETVIWNYLLKNGLAVGGTLSITQLEFFDIQHHKYNDFHKLEMLFGPVENRELRLRRRLEVMQAILGAGYETLPVTMAPPYRNLHLKKDDYITDELGNKWYNYHFDKPQGMSRVFGPLTRYKFYNTFEPSQELDFKSPNVIAWQYIADKYLECQQKYNFDFMRGDMSHVQPRKEGVPQIIEEFYDPLKYIKEYIQQAGVRYFSFFAETFIAPPNEMSYGNELEHLEAINADVTLGDLQASVVGSEDFRSKFKNYLDISNKWSFKTCFTIITADKDDPRFDEFYRSANHLRYFIGTFLSCLPSYIAMGFECRNQNLNRAINESYSKLYVFQISDNAETDKVTHGPYIWGDNIDQFLEFQKIKILAEKILPNTKDKDFVWITKPSISEYLVSWKIENYIFEANLNANLPSKLSKSKETTLVYNSENYLVGHECRIYKTK